MNYLRVYLVVFLALLISSCIGVVVPTKNIIDTRQVTEKDHIEQILYKDNILSNDNHSKLIDLDKIEHPKDGTIEIYSERQWCGITIMAIIVPIPLWLPLCKSTRTVTYKDNIPKKVVSTYPNSKLYACGPGIWIGTGMAHGSTQEFCSSATLWGE
ncbi:hypothetical protein [Francisella philomiragia]|uniref:hypothetical protein n=1 Tax=Francisella philomiragia TaxID=28110 RepID=UPI001907A606|nr:hypothetical protein [Francisella philomiragia]MBK2267826.1 hypothetical protein [Francisella philomiragia]MBK2279074.1 hypothetical protein [Francisella philomiragia]MBK2287137.1 hypothetical protein [Francisella philomiragia]MBK2288906.1 hypothetical protein [Francisella philomiragia]MBK2290624.1 hypothetical protein [Francisella philomiragia]